jgi:hypothetical protein
MTVSELINELQLLKDEGFGDETVNLASDEEGNDFRPVHEVTVEGIDEVTIWPY